MKKIISLTLILLVALGSLVAFPVNAESKKVAKSGDWGYKVMDDGNLRLYSYSGNKTDLIIPDYIDGYKVTKIRSLGKKVRVVRIGKNVEKILPDAISDSYDKIQKIVVSKDNKNYSSKNGLLLNKTGDKLVAYPGGINSSNIKLPKTIKYIGSKAFAYNNNLKKVVIPKQIVRIGKSAFECSKELKYVKIPKNVKYIGAHAFSRCDKITDIIFEKGLKVKMGSSVFLYCKSLKTVTFPYIIETKENQSFIFEECRRLKKVIIPDGIKYIPVACFEFCPSLKSVTIPSSVKKIGGLAFGYIMGDYVTKFNKDFVIKGAKNSAAHKYAKANGLKFKAIK